MAVSIMYCYLNHSYICSIGMAAFKGGGGGGGGVIGPNTLGELLPSLDFWKVNRDILDAP